MSRSENEKKKRWDMSPMIGCIRCYSLPKDLPRYLLPAPRCPGVLNKIPPRARTSHSRARAVHSWHVPWKRALCHGMDPSLQRWVHLTDHLTIHSRSRREGRFQIDRSIHLIPS